MKNSNHANGKTQRQTRTNLRELMEYPIEWRKHMLKERFPGMDPQWVSQVLR